MNRFQFVEDHKDAYGVKRLCEIVEIARSSFYAWLAAAPGRAARAAEDTALAARIRVLQDPAQGGDRGGGDGVERRAGIGGDGGADLVEHGAS